MKINFHSLTDARKPTEFFEQETNIQTTIRLANNENPLGPSPNALFAAQQALQSAHLYPDQCYAELKQALATFLSVKVHQITLGNGSENILELIIKAYLDNNVNAVISQH